jgi:hypothetical protein
MDGSSHLYGVAMIDGGGGTAGADGTNAITVFAVLTPLPSMQNLMGNAVSFPANRLYLRIARLHHRRIGMMTETILF